jgi:hypothetical protein
MAQGAILFGGRRRFHPHRPLAHVPDEHTSPGQHAWPLMPHWAHVPIPSHAYPDVQ